MTTAVVRTFKPTRSRVLTAVCFLAILFSCYGVLTAQQARSATTLTKKAFAGVKVVSGTATLVHPNQVTAIVYNSAGQYLVTFDRHVDNCSFAVTSGFYSGVFALGWKGIQRDQRLLRCRDNLTGGSVPSRLQLAQLRRC